MMPSLKSEFRKLLTIRSTYILSGIMLALIGFISFWVQGYRHDAPHPHILSDTVTSLGPTISIFVAIIGVLLMAHEYRYNVIVYTLTNSNSRTKVLLSKIITISVFTLFLTVFTVFLSFGLTFIGWHVGGQPVVVQQVDWLAFFGRTIFYTEAFALIGLLIATLIRNLVGAIVFLLIVPNTVESLLTLILKKNAIYLPFSALGQVTNPTPANVDTGPFTIGHLEPLKAAMLVTIYLIVAWVITWYVFIRRDAN